jgi:tetratricopeptide (TPR) repeat protein
MSNTPALPAPAGSVEKTFRQALALHRSGNLPAAQRLYNEVVTGLPGHAGALHGLGVLCMQRADTVGAVQWLGAAIAANERNAAAHADLASALSVLNRLSEAASCMARAVQLEPLMPTFLIEHGNMLLDLGETARALERFERALSLAPADMAALIGCAAAHLQAGRPSAALDCCDRALNVAPGDVAAHHTRADALHDLERYEDAVLAYDRALKLDPTRVHAWSNRGSALLRLRRCAEALASYDRTLALIAPEAVGPQWQMRLNACVNRGVALHELDRLEEALANYDRVIATAPQMAEAHANRGVLLRQLNRVEEALASINQAIAIRPGYADAHLSRAHTLLLLGDFANGWSEFEWRWRNPGSAITRDRRHSQVALWLGEQSIDGKTILLHAEQGLGDTLQFARYAALVAGLGARVLLEVPLQLRALLTGIKGVERTFARGDPLPAFDFQCPLMSLPLAMKTTMATVPAQTPYLQAEPVKSEQWRRRLGERRGLRVGLVWSGGFRPNQPEVWAVNRRRNIPLAAFASLARPDVEFHSLQQGESAEAELGRLMGSNWGGPQLIDHAGRIADFSDTAALIANLDLVIAVDTAVAHLAGAMGVPVWILNRFDACWRWLRERADSPWYPTARLYRQRRPGDWQHVLAEVHRDLHTAASRSGL